MSPSSSRVPRKRLAIVGGGMGGVATAWLCDREWSVALFEAKAKLGGNSDSETIRQGGRDLAVDLGAQFFHPSTHPTYIALLELLEAQGPLRTARAVRGFETPAGLCVLPLEGGDPTFSSDHLVRTPLHALDFALYASAARKMAFTGDYDVTMAEWVQGLHVSERFKAQILLPWLTASEGHPLEDTKRSSARAILQLFAPSHPKSPLTQPTFWSVRGGFQAPIDAMAEQCGGLAVHLQTAVARVEKVRDEWFVSSRDTRWGPFDAVVLNAPPWESKKLLGSLAWAAGLVDILDVYEHRPHQLAIHGDPAYVHRDPRSWLLANVGVEGANGGGTDARSELSVWLGASMAETSGKPLELFKSWTTHRGRAPRETLLERTFHHTIKTPAMMAAARRLQGWQGREGLWLAGCFTSGVDLQESALCSAMEVARTLSPSSPRLRGLSALSALTSRTDAPRASHPHQAATQWSSNPSD
jgi:predicted NAD/FAD-binding protein